MYVDIVSASVVHVLACSEEQLQPRLLPSNDIVTSKSSLLLR
jgi:hypothetical protein